jgi:hypothetical protein
VLPLAVLCIARDSGSHRYVVTLESFEGNKCNETPKLTTVQICPFLGLQGRVCGEDSAHNRL